MKLGAVSFPRAAAKLRQMGEFIVNGSRLKADEASVVLRA